ncbi:MAG: hypothetical protein IT477_10480 [Rhodanobacteraceae bacterium]|nr:hypothetical protein [Rhodanobacteraceae bacterium]
MFVGQTLFVDPVNGDNATAQRERLDLPYRSILNAVNAMQDGDEIILLPGNHLVPFTVTLPNFASLSIVSWGGREVTRITPPADGTPVFSRTFGPAGANSWLISGFTSTGGDGYTIDIGDPSVDRFVGIDGLLEIKDVTADSIRLRRLGRVRIDNSIIENGTSQVVGCSDVTMQNCRLGTFSLYYRNAGNNYQTALGRRAYRMIGCDVTQLVDLDGTPAFFADSGTTLYQVQATVGTVGTDDPIIQIAGLLGVSTANGINAEQAAGQPLSVVFANVAFAATPGVLAGLILDGATVFGPITLQFLFPLVAPQPLNSLVFGGRKANILGTLSVSAPAAANLYYCDFRGSVFGDNLILTDEAEIDLTGAAFRETNLGVTGVNGAYYRKEALTAGSPLPLVGLAGVEPFVAPFGSNNIAGTITAFGSTDDITAQPIALSPTVTDVSYQVTAAAGNISILGVSQ